MHLWLIYCFARMTRMFIRANNSSWMLTEGYKLSDLCMMLLKITHLTGFFLRNKSSSCIAILKKWRLKDRRAQTVSSYWLWGRILKLLPRCSRHVFNLQLADKLRTQAARLYVLSKYLSFPKCLPYQRDKLKPAFQKQTKNGTEICWDLSNLILQEIIRAAEQIIQMYLQIIFMLQERLTNILCSLKQQFAPYDSKYFWLL